MLWLRFPTVPLPTGQGQATSLQKNSSSGKFGDTSGEDLAGQAPQAEPVEPTAQTDDQERTHGILLIA